jgi:hypothetical protein
VRGSWWITDARAIRGSPRNTRGCRDPSVLSIGRYGSTGCRTVRSAEAQPGTQRSRTYWNKWRRSNYDDNPRKRRHHYCPALSAVSPRSGSRTTGPQHAAFESLVGCAPAFSLEQNMKAGITAAMPLKSFLARLLSHKGNDPGRFALGETAA